MDHSAGLDVSVKETSVCIVDDTGRIVREVKVASEPEALLGVLKNPGYHFKRIGLEAGPQGMLRLTVVDDGRGGEIREGSGLSGMRARLSAAGGALEVTSDARGTRLSAILPRAAA